MIYSLDPFVGFTLILTTKEQLSIRSLIEITPAQFSAAVG
jgi:hypothetical protein